MALGASPDSGALALRIGTAAVLIAGLLAALFLLPRAWFAGLVACVIVLAAFEWGRLCSLRASAAWGYAAAMGVAYLAAYHAEPWQPAFLLAALFWLGAAPLWLWLGVSSRRLALLATAGLVVLVPAGLAMTALRPLELLLTLAVVWIADTAAFFAGRAWGRNKLAPSISPGKTREGALGGIAGVLAYAIICGLLAGQVRWLPFLAAAAVLALLSIVGDLFESALKRQAQAKDSGRLLPGHGGILDRIDSATAVLPVAALVLPWVLAD